MNARLEQRFSEDITTPMRNSTKRKLPNKTRIPVSFTHFYKGVEPSDVDVSSIDETIENVSPKY